MKKWKKKYKNVTVGIFAFFLAIFYSVLSLHCILLSFHFRPWIWLIKNDILYIWMCVWHTVCLVIFFIYLLCAQAFFPAYFIYWNGNVCLLKFSFSPVDTKRNKNLLFLHTHTYHIHTFFYYTYQTNNAWYK